MFCCLGGSKKQGAQTTLKRKNKIYLSLSPDFKLILDENCNWVNEGNLEAGKRTNEEDKI